jgi:hypothetical protein
MLKIYVKAPKKLWTGTSKLPEACIFEEFVHLHLTEFISAANTIAQVPRPYNTYDPRSCM